MYKVMRRIANYPPHPVIMTTGNPWQTVSEHEDKADALKAHDLLCPARHCEYGVFCEGVRQEIE